MSHQINTFFLLLMTLLKFPYLTKRNSIYFEINIVLILPKTFVYLCSFTSCFSNAIFFYGKEEIRKAMENLNFVVFFVKQLCYIPTNPRLFL